LKRMVLFRRRMPSWRLIIPTLLLGEAIPHDPRYVDGLWYRWAMQPTFDRRGDSVARLFIEESLYALGVNHHWIQECASLSNIGWWDGKPVIIDW